MIDEDIESAPAPPDADLNRVAALTSLYLTQSRDVAALEEQLKRAREALRTTEEKDLPDAMLACGLRSFTTDHAKVEIDEKYTCGQLDDAPDKKGRRPLSERLNALAWLEDNGHGDLPKRTITITLGSASEQVAQELLSLIRTHRASNSFALNSNRVVLWNTLAAFAREQAQDAPLDTLGVTLLRRAKVTETDDGR